MKRYCEVDSVSNVLDCHNAECRSNAHYYAADEVKALCREVLPHIEASLRRRVKKMNQAVGHQSFEFHRIAVDDKQAIVDKLKAIIEGKP